MARQEPELIKRYGKRPSERLYNSATLSYVTPDDLAGMTLEGRRLVVRDAGSGEDITARVLATLH